MGLELNGSGDGGDEVNRWGNAVVENDVGEGAADGGNENGGDDNNIAGGRGNTNENGGNNAASSVSTTTDPFYTDRYVENNDRDNNPPVDVFARNQRLTYVEEKAVFCKCETTLFLLWLLSFDRLCSFLPL